MPITINGTGSISGLSAGGLPDNSIITADVANGAITQAKRSEQLTLATAQNSTSGTSIDFTGIPSWVKRVTVMFRGVSTSGTSNLLVQIGAGSVTTSSYVSGAWTTNTYNTTATSGYLITALTHPSTVYHGNIFICGLGSNTWVESHAMGTTNTYNSMGGGSVTLSGTLDRIRITTVNGTDTFDAGSINIMYE